MVGIQLLVGFMQRFKTGIVVTVFKFTVVDRIRIELLSDKVLQAFIIRGTERVEGVHVAGTDTEGETVECQDRHRHRRERSLRFGRDDHILLRRIH